jgi:two-component system response regulator DegU
MFSVFEGSDSRRVPYFLRYNKVIQKALRDNAMISVVIVDDHPVVRAGMRMILESADDIVVVAEGGSGSEALQLVEKHTPDVLVLDINLPDKSGIEVACQMHAQGSSVAILILTVHDDPRLIFELLENGVVGYVLKDEALETLANAVRAAARGESWLSPTVASHVVHRAVIHDQPHAPAGTGLTGIDLTPREFQIIRLLAEGFDNAAIAERLTVTKRTVQNHISNIYGKLGVASRSEAMLYAIRSGWVHVPSGENVPDDL